MSNHLTDVTVSIHVKLPGSFAILVENVLTHGDGTLTEALQGGQATFGMTLDHAKPERHLEQGELVYVRGMLNGQPFTLDNPLHVIHSHKPWTFEGTSGSTGA
jgi:hypothetical protein